MLKVAPIDDIRKFIQNVENLKGDVAIQSIDFLGFLTELSSFSDVNNSVGNNVQIINLTNKSKSIVCSAFEDMLSKFWFETLDNSQSAQILISTDVNDVIYLDVDKKRSIGNIKLELKFLKGEV